MGKPTRGARFATLLVAAAAAMSVTASAQTLTAKGGSARPQAEQALYSFTAGAADGLFPTTSLIQDSAGNFYGTTNEGAVGFPLGNGVAFKLSPTGTETILHAFQGGSDGNTPNGLVIDPSGNVYGTTQAGGDSRLPGGVMFKITPSGSERLIYTFDPRNGDGEAPTSTLLLDSAGNLYGTTLLGGSYNAGIVFKFSSGSVYSILYQFTGGADGGNPYRSRLVMDSIGNLYGLTNAGGRHNNGALFKLTPVGQESVLYSFSGGTDGGNPLGDLVMDSDGNF